MKSFSETLFPTRPGKSGEFSARLRAAHFQPSNRPGKQWRFFPRCDPPKVPRNSDNLSESATQLVGNNMTIQFSDDSNVAKIFRVFGTFLYLVHFYERCYTVIHCSDLIPLWEKCILVYMGVVVGKKRARQTAVFRNRRVASFLSWFFLAFVLGKFIPGEKRKPGRKKLTWIFHKYYMRPS